MRANPQANTQTTHNTQGRNTNQCKSTQINVTHTLLPVSQLNQPLPLSSLRFFSRCFSSACSCLRTSSLYAIMSSGVMFFSRATSSSCCTHGHVCSSVCVCVRLCVCLCASVSVSVFCWTMIPIHTQQSFTHTRTPAHTGVPARTNSSKPSLPPFFHTWRAFFALLSFLMPQNSRYVCLYLCLCRRRASMRGHDHCANRARASYTRTRTRTHAHTHAQGEKIHSESGMGRREKRKMEGCEEVCSW